MASEATAVQPLWAACNDWLRRAEEVIGASAEALNTLNVFPLPDADTGSNLTLTLRGIAAAVPVIDAAHLDEVVQAAILSAHGNSGAILAEMVGSACRTLGQLPGESGDVAAGAALARLLRRAASAATEAVARPVTGTILTVAEGAAAAAERVAALTPDNPLAVALGAQQGSRTALSQTTDQLEVLARAGVVDAGGQAFVLLVDVLVEVLGGPEARALQEVAPPITLAGLDPRASTAAQYEVMYAVRGADRASLDGLRTKLSELGHSVLVVGDQSVAQVHVHLEEPGVAVEAALGLGQLSQVRIVALHPATGLAPRAVICVVAGAGLAEAVLALGGVSVQGGRGERTLVELSAALGATDDDVVILPNDMETLEMASHLAAPLRNAGRRVAVIPTVAQVQGLAAIAVHEPTMDFESAVVAMSTAAGHTRQGAVTVAESAAMTMGGRCRVGDVLGLVEGDFVEIGDSVVEVAWRVLQRLLTAGGELVTLVAGAEADAQLLAELKRRLEQHAEQLDVETLVGGQSRYLVLIGVE